MMKRNDTIYHFVLAVFIALVMPSCSEDLPIPNNDAKSKITLIGEFVAGDSLHLRAGQSISLTKTSQLTMQLIQNLSIVIKDPAGSYAMTGYTDDNTASLGTLPYVINNKAQASTTYTVTATHPTLGIAAAEVVIPEQIQAIVTDTMSTTYAGDEALQIKIKIKDPGATGNYYVIEALKQEISISGFFYYNDEWHYILYERGLYEQLKATGNVITKFDTTYTDKLVRLAIYTSDMNSENAVDNGVLTRSKRVLLKDVQFNGTDYETTVYVTQNVNNSFGTYIPQGKVFLYIKSVNADYFKFLKAYETYTPSVSNTSSEQPVKIPGNVNNGLGMIGGATQVKYTYINDIWNF